MSVYFDSLEAIFEDELFEELVSSLQVRTSVSMDPEVIKFQELLDWIEREGREPEKTRNLTERQLFSRLSGIRKQPDKQAKFSPYDRLGILGGRYE